MNHCSRKYIRPIIYVRDIPGAFFHKTFISSFELAAALRRFTNLENVSAVLRLHETASCCCFLGVSLHVNRELRTFHAAQLDRNYVSWSLVELDFCMN